jgi:DHA1 family bicyclomycin/chloramphenicol resistance-like MFS transporter
MVGALAIDTYLPSIPAIGQEFQVGPLAVQQTLSLFLFAFAFMMLFYGTLSDSFGRRRVLLAALSVYTIASIGAAFAPTFGFLLGCRVLQGLSAGAGSVLSAAIVQDRFSGAQAQKMMSHIMMVFGLAPAIAPVLGGYLHMAFGWRSTFVFLFIFGLALMLLVYRTLPESLPVEKRHAFHPGTIARNYLMVLKRGKFVLLALTLGMAFGGLSLYIGSAANFVMGILGKSETGFAWLFIPLIGGMVLGSALSGKFAARYSPVTLVKAGFALMGSAGAASVAYNSMFVAETPWAVLPLAVYTFGLAIAMPAIQVKALALFPDNRGLAASMQGFIQMMSFALVSGFLAPVLFDSALNLAYGLAGTLAVSYLFWRLSGAENDR